MFKFWLLNLFSALLWIQLAAPATAINAAEALNNDLRERLKTYDRFLSEDESGAHKDDLLKLIKLTENALTKETLEEKQAIVSGMPNNFSSEFNRYIVEKLEGIQVNDDIQQALDFYRSLIATAESKFKSDIESTIMRLETILKVSDLKEKEENFLSLDKSFSPEFQKFLRESSLPNLNRELVKNQEFLESLLRDRESKYKGEIEALVEQIQVALGDVRLEEKEEALQKVTNPESKDVFEYLQKKYMELN